jgi:hypothetical protein
VAGGEISVEEREELRRLRRENQRLQMERDFLKKAAALAKAPAVQLVCLCVPDGQGLGSYHYSVDSSEEGALFLLSFRVFGAPTFSR